MNWVHERMIWINRSAFLSNWPTFILSFSLALSIHQISTGLTLPPCVSPHLHREQPVSQHTHALVSPLPWWQCKLRAKSTAFKKHRRCLNLNGRQCVCEWFVYVAFKPRLAAGIQEANRMAQKNVTGPLITIPWSYFSNLKTRLKKGAPCDRTCTKHLVFL